MPKNIVVFADGTGQEGGRGNNTNVYDLFNMIEDRTERQVSYYDKGLGTGWQKISGNISGAGISKNVQECYEFIFRNYTAGDRIYLFGFSRGATTVRTLAAFIHRFGVLPQSRPELIKRAYSLYKIRNKSKRRQKAQEFISSNHTIWCRVKFLGVWDTVAALGLPFKMVNAILDKIPIFRSSFHDLKLATSVDYARHALAIDDERKIFHPAIWDETDEDRLSQSDSIRFSLDDMTDVYSVVERLRIAAESALAKIRFTKKSADSDESGKATESVIPMDADPMSRFLLSQCTNDHSGLRELIMDFDPENKRVESEERLLELKTALTDLYNKFIDPPKPESLYDCLRKELEGDPEYFRNDEDKFAGIELSKESQELIRKRKAGKKLVNRDRKRLNRLLLEDAYSYSLSPLTFPRIKQVWFAGMHTDVGGGYPERGLSHIPLVWMLSEAMELGLLIYEKHKTEIRPNPAGTMHDSREKLGKYIYSQCVRNWDANKNRGLQPLVHESVQIRSQYEDLWYKPWILKMNFEVEPWPQRLRSSIQFDEHYIWREAFWGWGSAFTIPWSSVQHIEYDEIARTLKIHTVEGTSEGASERMNPIEVEGTLAQGVRDLLIEWERLKAQRIEDMQEKLNQKIDNVREKFAGDISNLKKAVKSGNRE